MMASGNKVISRRVHTVHILHSQFTLTVDLFSLILVEESFAIISNGVFNGALTLWPKV